MNTYYQQSQLVAVVDKDDQILKPVEKWQAHKQGVLHRGFTVILKYQDQVIFQYRNHPVFDRVFDLSFSSHPVYVNDQLQSDEIAILAALKREWNLDRKSVIDSPKLIDKVYYQAKDEQSEFTEQEIDYIYEIKINQVPDYNPDFAYGFLMMDKRYLKDFKQLAFYPLLAPWLKHFNLLIK